MKYSLLVALASVLTSCAYTAKTINLQDLPHLPVTITGVAFPLSLEAEHSASGSDGCILTLVHVEDGRSFETDVIPGQDLMVVELVPGTYEFHDAFCGKWTWDLTHHHLPRFLVQAGKLSFLDGLHVYMTGAYNMSMSPFKSAEDFQVGQKFLGRVSEENRIRLISGYTGKPIPPAALESYSGSKSWEVADGAGNQLSKSDRQMPSFRACYRGEADVNPLWLGSLELEATYQGGELVSSKIHKVWHSFSDQFVTCVQAVLKEFHPKAKSKLVYTIYL